MFPPQWYADVPMVALFVYASIAAREVLLVTMDGIIAETVVMDVAIGALGGLMMPNIPFAQ